MVIELDRTGWGTEDGMQESRCTPVSLYIYIHDRAVPEKGRGGLMTLPFLMPIHHAAGAKRMHHPPKPGLATSRRNKMEANQHLLQLLRPLVHEPSSGLLLDCAAPPSITKQPDNSPTSRASSSFSEPIRLRRGGVQNWTRACLEFYIEFRQVLLLIGLP